jgi:putative membrane protein
MKLLLRFVLVIIANAAALWLSAIYIPGFHLNPLPDAFALSFAAYRPLLALALILTVLNLVLKPVLKLILGPVIVLTLGLAIIAINAAVLFSLTFFSENLTIDSVLALIGATIVVGIMNSVAHALTR